MANPIFPNIGNNPYRSTAFACTGIIVLGIVMIVLPGILGMEAFKGGLALSFFGGFWVIVGVISVIAFARLARLFDLILQKENVLVHWTYSLDEWQEYAEEEHREDKADKGRLFILVAAISAVAGIILWAIYPHDLLLIICIVLGIIIVMGLTAYLSVLFPYKRNKRQLGEVYIAKDGAYLNRRLHIWKGMGTRLMDANYEVGSCAQPRIRIRYSSINSATRNYYTARIPVPPGQEEMARKVVSEISSYHLSNKKFKKQKGA